MKKKLGTLDGLRKYWEKGFVVEQELKVGDQLLVLLRDKRGKYTIYVIYNNINS